MFDLHGKTALVTGSSRGIGKAIAVALAENGADVIVHCRRDCDSMRNTMLELSGLGTGNHHAVFADLGEKNGADVLVSEVEELGAEIDILFLNASVELRREWTEISDDEFDLQINTNLRSSVKLLQRLVPGMQQRGWGRVITVGSVQQRKPHEAMLLYAASKAALSNISLSLAMQLAPYGVTVNNIAPGAIRTDRNAEALSDPAYDEHVRNLIPMKYIGYPRDIAGIALYLASEESKYMTGQDIYIDGGKGL